MRLKVSTDHENDIKGIRDWNTNHGDQSGISLNLKMIVSKKKGENFIKYSKKIKWDSKLTQEKFSSIVRDLLDKSDLMGKEGRVPLSLNVLNSILLKAKDSILKETSGGHKIKNFHGKYKRFCGEFLTLLYSTRNYCNRKKLKLSKSKNRNLMTIRFYDTVSRNLNKKIRKIIRKRKSYIEWLERQELMNKYTKHPNLFWREMNNRNGTGVQMDIELYLLWYKYRENFNNLTQTAESKCLQNKMEEIIAQYGLKVKDDSSPVKVDSVLIKNNFISKLKNNKKAGKNVS